MSPGERRVLPDAFAVDLGRSLMAGRALDGLFADGDLSLAGLRTRSLPARLTVSGSLNLVRCQRLRRIGAGLHVGGSLRIGGGGRAAPWLLRTSEAWARPGTGRDCPIDQLPAGLVVGGSLVLRNCTRLLELPADLAVERSIRLYRCTSLLLLPAGLHVHGNLKIVGGPALTALPDGLVVEGDLTLVGTSVTRLPSDLEVGRDLNIIGPRRSFFFTPGAKVKRNVSLLGYRGTTFQCGIPVNGSLEVASTTLKATPDGLAVKRDLDLSRCPALEVVGRAEVGGDLDLQGAKKLTTLAEGMTVHGRVTLRDCASLPRLPDGFVRRAAVEVAGATALVWPEDELDAAVRYQDVVVPARMVFHPERLEPRDVLRAPNAELRRVALDRIGVERFLELAEHEVLDEDTDRGGPRRLIAFTGRRRPDVEVTSPAAATPAAPLEAAAPSADAASQLEPPRTLGARFMAAVRSAFAPASFEGRAARPSAGAPASGPRRSAAWRPRGLSFLLCQCPSTGRKYLLGVPPDTSTCTEAAAWLAGYADARAYHPDVET